MTTKLAVGVVTAGVLLGTSCGNNEFSKSDSQITECITNELSNTSESEFDHPGKLASKMIDICADGEVENYDFFLNATTKAINNIDTSSRTSEAIEAEECVLPYIVDEDDNLTSISRKLGSSITQIMNMNPQIKHRDHIEVGWVLKIPQDC